jgi:DNA-3-methyladenine glycosylase
MNNLQGFFQGNRDFFVRDVLKVAPEVLGCVLQRTNSEGTVSIRITEVEAYAGERDPGAHSYRGMTKRNATMFGPPGHLYCYFTYGMHHALNLVTGKPGQPYGCLIRAGEVIEGADIARTRREAKLRKTVVRERDLARGPGCVAQSFAATLANDGDDLFSSEWCFLIPDDHTVLPHMTGPRVGVSGPGGDGVMYPWRFWLAGSSSVSIYKPGRT